VKKSSTKTAKTRKPSVARKYKPNMHNEFESATANARRSLGTVVVLANQKKWGEAAKVMESIKGMVTQANSTLAKLVNAQTA
jgi:hypothetical protein